MARTWVVILLLSLLAGATWWLAETAKPTKPGASNEGHLVEYFMANADILVTDEGGQRQRRLVSPLVVRYKDDLSSELETPSLWLYDPPAPPWEGHSHNAWVGKEGRLIRLRGQVQMRRTAYPDHPPLEIATQNLEIYPERGFARTPAHAVLSRGLDTLEGDGLEAWFHDGIRLKLLARVKGLFHPQPQGAGAREE